MKSKLADLSARIYTKIYYAKRYMLSTTISIISAVKFAWADDENAGSGAVWDSFSSGADGGWATFCAIYTNKVWLVPTAFAIFAYFKAKDDKMKHAAFWSVVGCVAMFLFCKVPIATLQATGDTIAGWFNWG